MPSDKELERCVCYEESSDKELKEGQLVGVFCRIKSLRGEPVFVALPIVEKSVIAFDSPERIWTVSDKPLHVSGEKLSILEQQFPGGDGDLEGILEARIFNPTPDEDEKRVVEIKDPEGKCHYVNRDNLFIPEG